MKRAVNQVYDLARANHFDWFITLTFNPDIVDRTNYDECAKLIVLFTKKLRRNGNAYIIVPELHSDGKSYHFHGLVQGELDLTHWKGEVYNLNSFEFGYTTAMEIRDPARVATYIAKYLTKELSVPKGRKCYFFGVPGRSVDIPHKRIARHIHILHRGLSQTPRGPIDAGEYGRFIIAEEWGEVWVGTYPTQQNKDFVELGGELRHMIV